MFSEREPGHPILFSGDLSHGQGIKYAFSNGDSVELMIGVERIRIRSVTKIGRDLYRGIVDRFESGQATPEGLRVGQEVEFDEKHIFTCISA